MKCNCTECTSKGELFGHIFTEPIYYCKWHKETLGARLLRARQGFSGTQNLTKKELTHKIIKYQEERVRAGRA